MSRPLVIVIALAVGLFMLSVDRRTDDTAIEVGLIVISALVLAFAAPRAALAVALAIGLPIAVLDGGVPALVFAGAGAGVGYVLRRNAAF